MTARNPVSEIRPRLVDAKFAAAYLGKTPRQFRRWIDEKKCPLTIVPQQRRHTFYLHELDAYIDSLPSWVPANGDENPNSRPVGRRPAQRKPKQQSATKTKARTKKRTR